MSKESIFQEMTPSKDEVESLRKTKFKVNKTKLKPEWKLACAILCTIALMLECTNVILSSRCNENNHSVQVQREDKTITPRVMSTAANNETSLCTEIREFKLGVGDKRVNVCTYEGRVRIDIREFLNDKPTIRGIFLTSREYIALKAVLPLVRDELLRQMKIIRN